MDWGFSFPQILGATDLSTFYWHSFGMTTVDELLQINGLSDLVLNGHQKTFTNVAGIWQAVSNPFDSSEQLKAFAVELAASSRKRLDFASPFADVAIGPLRYHLALPISGGDVHVSIRKHQAPGLALQRLIEVPARWLEVLDRIVASRANFIIAGGTGTGKTTLLRAMLERDQTQRIVTVEDVPELYLDIPNAAQLQSRQANSDGAGEINLQRLVIEALRMKPDRIAVGEVRGLELVPMLQALNSGHRGSATTIHANRAEDVPARLLGIGLLGGLSPTTTAHLASSAFDYVISLGPRTRGINITAIASFTLTNESKLVTKREY